MSPVKSEFNRSWRATTPLSWTSSETRAVTAAMCQKWPLLLMNCRTPVPWLSALGDEKSVGDDAQGGMVMETPPAPTLVVCELELLLEFLVVRAGPGIADSGISDSLAQSQAA